MQTLKTVKRITLAVSLGIMGMHSHAAPPVPSTPRDYRVAWCATVSNIDWPPSAGTSAATVNAQKARLIAHLDTMQALKMNAMYLQVRPACDAMYASTIEPWSAWLTGSQNSAATYDPLTFAVEEAHKRGIELHAWINPYRAALDQNAGTKSPRHVMRARPDLCVAYSDGRTYMDPGKQGTIDWIRDVVADIVTRYDVDGVAMDDYFYPGPTFADGATYAAYSGPLGLDDWRRDNVNRMIQTCYNTVHSIRNSCQFEVGPFGIWRPGNPTGVTGADYYTTHYCDTKKWLQMGWVDSLSPQLYWPQDSPGQPFGKLIDWWVAQNPNRHVMASTADYRVGNSTYANWGDEDASEIAEQVTRTHQAGGVGTVHYSIRWLTDNPAGVYNALLNGPYAKHALRPASTWLDSIPPPPPNVSIALPSGNPLRRRVTFSQNPAHEKASWWCVNTWNGTAWTLTVLPGSATFFDAPANTLEVAVSAVDRCANESARTQTTAVTEWDHYEDELY